MQKVKKLLSRFTSFEKEYVSREQNFRAYLMSKLATSKTTRFNITNILETLASPIIESGKVYSLKVIHESCWMSPILHYLHTNFQGTGGRNEDSKIDKPLSLEKNYKMGRVSPMLWCLGEHETILVLVEVHKGAYNSHIGGKSLAKNC